MANLKTAGYRSGVRRLHFSEGRCQSRCPREGVSRTTRATTRHGGLCRKTVPVPGRTATPSNRPGGTGAWVVGNEPVLSAFWDGDIEYTQDAMEKLVKV